MTRKTLSVLFKLPGTRGLIVGDDGLTESWALFAASQDAEVRFIHPQPSESILKQQSTLPDLRWARTRFHESDLEGCDWLVVTLSDRQVCEGISEVARKNRVLSAFLHFPELGSMVIPLVFDFDSVQLVLPLGAADPQVAEKLARSWQQFLPPDFARAIQLFKSIEKKLELQFKDKKYRPKIFDSLLASHFSVLIGAGRWNAAEELADKILQSYAPNPEKRQRVSARVGVQLLVNFQAEGGSYHGKVFNLSRDGAFIATQDIFPKLTHITGIDFKLPSGESVTHADGFVVWENTGQEPRAPIYPPGFAIMFDSLSQDNLQAIERYVQSQLK